MMQNFNSPENSIKPGQVQIKPGTSTSTFAGERRSRTDHRFMTLLAIELGSLHSEIYTPIIKQTLQNVDSQLYIVIFLTPELLSKLNSPAKRAGRCQRLQELISALYVCTAAKSEISCDIIFTDWCGYSLADETWEYSTLSIPECNPRDGM